MPIHYSTLNSENDVSQRAQTMIPMGIRPTLLEIMALSHAKREKLDREVVERIGGILDGMRQRRTCNREMMMDRSKIPCPPASFRRKRTCLFTFELASTSRSIVLGRNKTLRGKHSAALRLIARFLVVISQNVAVARLDARGEQEVGDPWRCSVLEGDT